MSDVSILHNPRCTKSRATLALLTDRGTEPFIVDYLNEPPSIEELAKTIGMLGAGARRLMRTEEPEYRELGLEVKSQSGRDLIVAMCAQPCLIQRPIVAANGKAAIGRRLEAVQDIL